MELGEVKQEEGTSFCGLSIQDISEGVIKISQTGYLKQIGSNDKVNLEQEFNYNAMVRLFNFRP